MRTRFLVLVTCLLGACAGPSAPEEPPPSPASEDVRRLAAILDYVSSDYAGAVKDGQVLDAGEYQEQLSFMHDAAELAGRIGDAKKGVAGVDALVQAKADPAEVATAARTLRRQLLDAHGLVLAPSAPPSRARAASLFAQNCAACHGATGGGDGPAGATLKPPPRSFRDPAIMAEMSPVRAFNALTDGMKGTAMVSWSTLSTADRWALASYVFTLRHDAAAEQRGAAVYVRAGQPVPATAAALAGMTDGQLDKVLGPDGADGVAWLRGVAAFASTQKPLEDARRQMAAAIALYKKGDGPGARQAAGQAYLDGFEPHEGALRARDAELVTMCEEVFLKIRGAIGAGAPVEAIEKEARQLDALLDRAEETLGGGGGAQMAFVGAAVVVVREGVEAALLLMLLLGLARRQGTSETAAGDARAVHLGWMVALGLGVITWFASEALVGFSGASRELMEGVVSLIAAAALLMTGHFVIARIDAKHRVDAMKRRLAEAASSGKRRTALAFLAFLAVYREAFEVVLFLRAIALDANVSRGAVAAGAGAGALLLIGVVALLLKLGKRLKPGPLLATMGTLLCVLAVVLAGKGVRALQEAGVIGIKPLELPRIEWLGLFPSVEGLLAQLLVLGAFVVIAVVAMRARRQTAVPA